MPREALVSDVMTRRVRTLAADAKVSELRRFMAANEFHHVPILEDERLVGIISWRDLVRAYRAVRSAGEMDEPGGFDPDDVLDQTSQIADWMTRKIVSVRPDEPLDAVIDLIADGDIHSVLVVDEDGQLAGIVTEKDVVAYLAS